ncbi:cellulase family glycosylhydrolase [Hymenobacter nivis]|uniref:mannan endo-1,4-beta-mannosidase n=1 Tax=Hymenobacter nivis TaxID=1850093 RepID=A0A502GQ22_9BACT|nr:cellulase family glycosylhydrolase [Hymenobacter nivis]TPG63622.1 membrane or secreted protein [Hymenobacter nivis]
MLPRIASFLTAALLGLTLFQPAVGQAPHTGDVFVDKGGVLRWAKGKQEVALFGVNYTAPFAYSYRALGKVGADREQAIRQDVYHLARLGVDAFRIHVWDVEISDTLGNLKENDHLRLLDYLVDQLERRGIKIILTPIAYWNNGYPEKDTGTGFSSIYGKDAAYTNPRAVAAQEHYLTQFLNHRNPYTKQLVRQDPGILAFEVCNEPRYHQPEGPVTAFADRMAGAIRATGCRKPVFYNIAESPQVHNAILNAKVDGLTFQWYPEGLVGGHTLHGNFLPYVDRYPIPYAGDARFKSKAKMAYEFESADVVQPVMYPFMARSFRTAGLQWATMFAYDPLAIAYANTEYQTHYLNLAYTPAKAISLLIAGQVFRRTKRGQAFPSYPADSTFGAFRVSYREGLSEMNTPDAFYYTTSTGTRPVAPAQLRHVAGTGASAVVRYGGLGAYFLDRLAPGVWRLEVLPDAVPIRDPFAKTSLAQPVTQILWNDQPVQLMLPGLGDNYTLRGINEGNTAQATATGGRATVRPGVYVVAAAGQNTAAYGAQTPFGAGQLGEFAAPAPTDLGPQVRHTPPAQTGAGQPLRLTATLTGVGPRDTVLLVAQHYYGRTTQIVPMVATAYATYAATVPAALVYPGLVRYWLVLRRGGQARTFPGNFAGQPGDWDYAHPEHWEVPVVAAGAPLPLFSAGADKDLTEAHGVGENQGWTDYVTTPTGALALRLAQEPASAKNPAPTAGAPVVALRAYFGDRLASRPAAELAGFRAVVVRVRPGAGAGVLRLSLATRDAVAYTADVPVTGTDWQEVRVPLAAFRPAPLLLVPRPYPGFLPLDYTAPRTPGALKLADAEVLQVVLGAAPAGPAPLTVDLESVSLQ